MRYAGASKEWCRRNVDINTKSIELTSLAHSFYLCMNTYIIVVNHNDSVSCGSLQMRLSIWCTSGQILLLIQLASQRNSLVNLQLRSQDKKLKIELPHSEKQLWTTLTPECCSFSFTRPPVCMRTLQSNSVPPVF